MAAISKQLSIYACTHSILSQAELIDVQEVVEDRAVTFELIELVEFDGCRMTGYPPRLLAKEEERVEERGDFSIIA
ncbi:hypothetical protein G6F42_020519 [Rhizopus arrhizus]|nr:hypothetical protein G6F42_020519 [Rhizopus arrhizus]